MSVPIEELLHLWLEPPAVERMPTVAANFVARGLGSPAIVAAAAMYPDDHPDDIRRAFIEGLTEMGSPWSSREQAIAAVTRRYAQQYVAGDLALRDVIGLVSPLYHFDDYVYGRRSPEVEFWWACWLMSEHNDASRVRRAAELLTANAPQDLPIG